MGDTLRIIVSGRFRVETSGGEILTPKGAKNQGLLALLATAPRMERGKVWLQDKLWSTRAPEQGSASLRQALSDLRKYLGPFSSILISERGAVMLNTNRVELVTNGDGEFLEGLDIKDPEFDHWLAMMRAQARAPAQDAQPSLPAPAKEPIRPILHFMGSNGTSQRVQWYENLTIDAISQSLLEVFSASIFVGPAQTPSSGLRIKITYLPEKQGTFSLRIVVEDVLQGRRIWSATRSFQGEGQSPTANPEVVQMINLIIDVLTDTLGVPNRVTQSPNSMCRMAIRKMFSMQEAQVAQADALLAQAYELDPRAIYLGWRAQIKVMQFIERHKVDVDAIQEEGTALARQAVEMEPYNSMVLAAAANTHLLLTHQIEPSLELAQRGIRVNSTNPMVWWALSSGKLYSGDEDSSYQMAKLASQIAAFSPFGFWFELQMAAASMVQGQLPEAKRLFQKVRMQRPDFRPASRYLIALHAHDGETDQAVEAANHLMKLEPDFTIPRLVEDREYPSSLLHRENGIRLDRLGALA